MVLKSLIGHFFPMSFGQSFCFAWFWVCIWYISGSSCVLAHLSARTDLAKRFMNSLASLPFWLSRSRQVGKVSLALRMTNIWSLIFYLGRTQPPLSSFWSIGPHGMNSNCLALLPGESNSFLIKVKFGLGWTNSYSVSIPLVSDWFWGRHLFLVTDRINCMK